MTISVGLNAQRLPPAGVHVRPIAASRLAPRNPERVVGFWRQLPPLCVSQGFGCPSVLNRKGEILDFFLQLLCRTPSARMRTTQHTVPTGAEKQRRKGLAEKIEVPTRHTEKTKVRKDEMQTLLFSQFSSVVQSTKRRNANTAVQSVQFSCSKYES